MFNSKLLVCQRVSHHFLESPPTSERVTKSARSWYFAMYHSVVLSHVFSTSETAKQSSTLPRFSPKVNDVDSGQRHLWSLGWQLRQGWTRLFCTPDLLEFGKQLSMHTPNYGRFMGTIYKKKGEYMGKLVFFSRMVQEIFSSWFQCFQLLSRKTWGVAMS